MTVRSTGFQIAILTLGVALLLVLSSSLNVAAQSSSTVNGSAASWNGADGNFPYNYDYSPQTIFSQSNVNNLQVSWIYPIPPSPPTWGPGDNGIIITPIIENGIVYSITNYHLLIAQNAQTGAIIWQQQLSVTYNESSQGVYTNLASGHYHEIWYTSTVRGTPLVWVVANNYTVYAFNAFTGDVNLTFNIWNMNQQVQGNFGQYTTITPEIAIDENNGLAIAGVADTEGVTAGRGFFVGYNITTTPATYLWQTFTIPPQDGSDPMWSINSVNNMSDAWIFNGTGAVNLKTLSPSVLNSTLYDDWGNFGFNGTVSYAGSATAWGGSYALNPDTGVFYLATAQPSPDWNASERPGPDLWSDSVLAVNGSNGNIIWAFQTDPHDMWDYDCSWSVLLGNTTQNGVTVPTVFKACKNGYTFALNANTGALLWYYEPQNILYSYDANNYNNGVGNVLNPLNSTEMHLADQCIPPTQTVTNGTVSCTQNPDVGVESDPAYDPITNLLFVADQNQPSPVTPGDVSGPSAPNWETAFDGNAAVAAVASSGSNTTIWALNANTGQPVWKYYIPNVGYRGGVTVSNGVVYVPTSSGYLYFLNEMTGALIGQKFIGAALITEPAIGQTASGQQILVMPGSGSTSDTGGLGGNLIGTMSPGFMFALTLSNSSSSSSASTSSSSAVPPASTITSVSTVVSSVTVSASATSSGVSSTAFYGVVVIAIILLITTALFAMRKRPAASSASTTTTTTTPTT